MKISAIVPAAGTGSRYSPKVNKLLEDIKGVPVIVHTLWALSSVEEIAEIIIPTSEDLIDDLYDIVSKYNLNKVRKIIIGGKTRQESIFKALQAIDESESVYDFILIHDGARPLISQEIIQNAIVNTLRKRATVVAVPAKDTVKRVDTESKQVIETLKREELWNVQTPQIFRFSDIMRAHIVFQGQSFTDDSAMIEKHGIPVSVVMGSYKNIKITTQEDIEIANILIDTL